jgi:uncharacterized protein (UPF0218 family)
MPSRSGRRMFSSELWLLPPQREFLKRPLGALIPGRGDEAWGRAIGMMSELRPRKVISVGDETSGLFLDHGGSADVYIVDGLVKRERLTSDPLQAKEGLWLDNPAGRIVREAWEVVGRAISMGGGIVVKVRGEEDLLTLVAILEAPSGSLVFYGQPGEGLVAVNVTASKKREIERFVEAMERR